MSVCMMVRGQGDVGSPGSTYAGDSCLGESVEEMFCFSFSSSSEVYLSLARKAQSSV